MELKERRRCLEDKSVSVQDEVNQSGAVRGLGTNSPELFLGTKGRETLINHYIYS